MTNENSDRLACGHTGPPAVSQTCEHLFADPDTGIDYVRWFTGKGLSCDFMCKACLVAREAGRPSVLLRVCSACLNDMSWYGGSLEFLGFPEIKEQPVPFEERRITVELPAGLPPLIDLAPIPAMTMGTWLGLCGDGSLVAIDTMAGRFSKLANAPIPHELAHPPWNRKVPRPRVCVSRDGRFAAIVNDYGRLGVVCETGTGRVTLDLVGGSHHTGTVPFSLCFAELDGKAVVVHRTDWNRLDASDPATGKLLTAREFPTEREGKPIREHALDYFHGRLFLSPDGMHVLNDGWVWHPVGIPTTFSLARWLREYPWETEDGPSKRRVAYRDGYWDHGMCWIDVERMAIEGIGECDDQMVPGARIFDLRCATADESRKPRDLQETSSFAGPTGEFFSDGCRLFSSDSTGLSIWDLEAGARIGRIAGFRPQHHHREACELVERFEDRIVIWRYSVTEP